MNKLYRLTNHLGEYFVIAEHSTEAEEKLMKMLNDDNYGLTDRRIVKHIELLATEANDKRFISGHFLLT